MIKHTLFAIGIAAASLGAVAAETSPATPRVDQRQEQQQARIERGAASGRLTPHEQRRLHREQAVVAKAEAAAKADGTVTARERHRLHHLQGHASRDIHRQTHDAQRAPATP